jgi:hypothetical protein
MALARSVYSFSMLIGLSYYIAVQCKNRQEREVRQEDTGSWPLGGLGVLVCCLYVSTRW